MGEIVGGKSPEVIDVLKPSKSTGKRITDSRETEPSEYFKVFKVSLRIKLLASLLSKTQIFCFEMLLYHVIIDRKVIYFY